MFCMFFYIWSRTDNSLWGNVNEKAVVTTNVGAVSQIINNNNNGLIVPVKNSEEIAMAIEKLIFDKQLRENIANNALNFSKEFFS